MTISSFGRTVPRDVRSSETARLFALIAEADEAERESLLDQVVTLNIQVAHAIARRYQNRGVLVEDLEQVACLALVRAARRFDHTLDRDFLSYAVPTMTGEVKRYFRDHGWTIRPPRRIQEIQSRVIQAFHQGEERGSHPSAEKLAVELDLPASDVAEALQAEGCFTPVSLDVPVTEDGRAAIDRLTDDDATDEKAMEARLMLSPALRRLSERDRRILHLRFVEDKTQQQIGDDLGVTQMQASRLLKRILETLRSELGSDALPA